MKISPLDLPNNKETFFKVVDNQVIKSSDIRELVNENTNLSPLITQIFDVYGSRVPYPFTVFEGIYRVDKINPNEILLKEGKILLKDPFDLNSIDEDWELSDYYESLNRSIICNTKYAAVFLSSGWDSSTILGRLVKQMPRENIKTFTLKLDLGSEQPANIFELEKAKQICEHFDVENFVIESSFYDDLEKAMKKSSEKMLFAGASLSHSCLWDSIVAIGLPEEDTTVFAGEFSDGAHNFGFAQNFGAIYPEKGFREYGDKIRNYFLSPSFLKRLINEDNIKDDFLVKNFSPSELINYRNWSENKLMHDLIKKIFIDDSRGPFLNISMTKDKYKKDTCKILDEVIFSQINPRSLEEWYSLIIRQYNNFHWSGSTVRGIELHNPGHYKVNMPYGNQQFLKVLEKMPTKFGRGLEPLPAKYPLKKYCEEIIDNYPFKIQEGHHAYLYDVDQSVSLINIAYANTDLKRLLKTSWTSDRFHIRKTFLEDKIFQKMNEEIISQSNDIPASTIFHANSLCMLDQFLEFSKYKVKECL